MTEGRLQIYQAASRILNFLVENRAISQNRRLTYQEVLAATGIDGELFGAAYEYLRSSGYVMAPISEEEMWVTAKGMEHHRGSFEDFFRKNSPDFHERFQTMLDYLSSSMPQPNPPSPSPSNVINIKGDVYNSQFQQGTEHSSQTGSFTSIQIDRLRNLLDEIHASLPGLALHGDDKREAEAVIADIETQFGSPPPKQGAIRKSLESLQRIFEGAIGSALGSSLALKIAQFMDYMEWT